MPKSKAHQAVEKFYKDVKGLDYKYGYQQEHLAGRAAFALETEFRALLAEDENNPNSSAQEAQQKLIQDALNIVTKYEKAMKVAPGTVNEFKLFINQFFGKELFKLKGSVFSESYKAKDEKEGTQEVAGKFKQYKEELEKEKTPMEDARREDNINTI
ncbi:hypothetical protein LEAN103870_16405 [Legionella anisa]|uniref:Uncharacterized protein n=1 Tax=Legionella anisa TaxID=28082 RepID=A0AAX0WWC2_9GAMM|nr:hypothetical protein [Legionella anisa]AWN72534.1 hypothetical protein DLD14_00985 [Legionella anisa]KTC75791.1 hypothetical protein Lani_0614 [Legionella anisa]MBN5935785.1 hypothetical protein [Legionella anisa]MCW8423305.1 hypothetical protein [Legionella anisa]MCW8446824.1 hypothetical protein [Legionella anisa]